MASIDLASPAVSAGGSASAVAKQRVADGIAGLKSYGLLYGSSPVMLDLYEQIERVAGTDATALEASRELLLGLATVVIPGHGGPFRPGEHA